MKIIYVWFVCILLWGSTSGGTDFPAPDGKAAGVVSSTRIEAHLQPDGRIFLARPGETPFGSLSPVMQLSPDAEAEKLQLVANVATRQGIEQRWRDAGGRYELQLSLAVPDQPWVKITTAVKNLTAEAGRVRVVWQLVPTPELGTLTDYIAFRKKWLKEVPTIAGTFAGAVRESFNWTWGTDLFCCFAEEFGRENVYETDPITGAMVLTPRSGEEGILPLAAVGNERGGLVLSGNPRAGFLFGASTGGLSAGHIYYLPAEKEFVDGGFFDGDAEVTYDLYAGYPERFDWAYLWKQYYCRQNEWLRSGPEPVTLVTAEELPTPAQPAYAAAIEFAGVNNLGTGVLNMFNREEQLASVAQSGAIRAVQQAGYRVPLWTNIFMAPDLDGHGRHSDPALDYRNFRDSWIVDSAGKPLPNWDGFMCTPSPRYSFARFEFKRLTDWVLKYDLDGIFVDFYATSTGVDESRKYAHFPFYPLQVAMIEYTRLLSDWCVANGKMLILNCPHPSLMVWHLGNNFQGDTAGVTSRMALVEKFAAASAGRTHTLLGPLRNENAGSGEWLYGSINEIFNGNIPSPWRRLAGQPPEELAVIGWLFGRNRNLAEAVGTAELAGGDLDRKLWYAGRDGRSGFITLRNLTPNVVQETVKLAERVTLPPGNYRVILWDPVSPPVVLDSGDETVAQREYRLLIPPDRLKVLCFVETDTAAGWLESGRQPVPAFGKPAEPAKKSN